MTRINTNVSSLIAQKTLQRSNAGLQESLTRLSTGLRINVGKDDPAGLIASEALRSDIISVRKAITNSERANQLIATADSALGQVSSLLNDIRGLVSEAANVGALSDDQIAANQLQIDSSLEAIDRIAQITSFQGKRLLDGNLDFISNGVSSDIQGLQIDQANFGTQTQIGVDVNVVQQATRAELRYAFGAIADATVLEVAGANGTEAFQFAAGSTIDEIATAVNLVSDATGVTAEIEQSSTTGSVTVSSYGANNDLTLTANQAGESAGNIRIKYTKGNDSATTVNFNSASGSNPATIDVALQTKAYVAASGQVDDSNLTATKAEYELDFDGVLAAGTLTIQANKAGSAYHGISVNIINDDSLFAGTAAVSYDSANKALNIRIDDGVTTSNAIKAAFTAANLDPDFAFSVTAGGNAEAVSADTGVPRSVAAGVNNVLTQTVAGVGGDNNALDIAAKLTGADFNGTAVHFVAGNGTAAGITSTLTQRSSTFYGETSGTLTNNDLKITAVKGGSFDGANGGDITVNFVQGGATAVTFDEDTGVLTVTADYATGVTAASVVTAINGATSAQGNALNTILFAENAGGDGSGDDNLTTAFVTANTGRTLGDAGTITQTVGVLDLDGSGTETAADIAISVVANSEFDGLAGNGIRVVVQDNTNGTVSFDETTGILTIDHDIAGAETSATLQTRLSNAGNLTVQGNKLSDFLTFTGGDATNSTAGATAGTQLDALNAGFASSNVGTGDINAVAGTGVDADRERVVYSHDAQAAQAAVTLAGANNDFIVRALEAGSAFNDVKINVVGQAGTAGLTNGAKAAYDADNKEITITFDNTDAAIDATAFAAAIESIEIDGEQAFEVLIDQSVETTNDLSGTINGTTLADGTVGNTGNTGGDAGTLFVYIEEGVTKASDVVAALGRTENARAAQLFSFANSQDNDGSGLLFADTISGALSGGITGGGVIATANDVVNAINGDSGAGAISTAALAAGNDGYQAVTTFEEFAFTGSVEKSNRLQFLSPEGGPNIRFTSSPGTSLGVDLTSDPRTEGFSALTIQGSAADSTLVFTARQTGTDFDGYKIVLQDSADVTAGNEVVVLDKEAKTLTFLIEDGATTAEDVRAALENDDYASQVFRATHFGTSDGSGNITVADSNATANAAARSTGGLESAGTLVINLQTDANGLVKTTANDLIAFFNDPSKFVTDSAELASTTALLSDYGISVSNAEGSTGTGLLEVTTADATFSTSGTALTDAQASGTTFSVNGANAQLTFTAVTAGAAYDNVRVVFQSSASVTKGNETAAYDATAKTLTIQIDDGNTTAEDIEGIFTSGSGNYNATVAGLFTATAGGTGAGLITNLDTTTLTGGVVDSGTTDGAALLGNEDSANSGLTFRSTEFGSNQFVSVKALAGSFNVVDENGASATRSSGSDIIARINGIQAVGKGRQASVNTSSLDLSFTVSSTVTDGSTFSFNITGGGALFQLGPDVVSNQQARLGIQSVSTATLGGVNGRLFELRSGGNKALDIDAKGAAKVVEEVISSVTKLRGRLGAFQRTTLETNIFTLNDTLANLTDAESSIRDADFAAESANLTRSQILVQSGTSVLSIANSNPQNVLSLLR